MAAEVGGEARSIRKTNTELAESYPSTRDHLFLGLADVQAPATRHSRFLNTAREGVSVRESRGSWYIQ